MGSHDEDRRNQSKMKFYLIIDKKTDNAIADFDNEGEAYQYTLKQENKSKSLRIKMNPWMLK